MTETVGDATLGRNAADTRELFGEGLEQFEEGSRISSKREESPLDGSEERWRRHFSLGDMAPISLLLSRCLVVHKIRRLVVRGPPEVTPLVGRRTLDTHDDPYEARTTISTNHFFYTSFRQLSTPATGESS